MTYNEHKCEIYNKWNIKRINSKTGKILHEQTALNLITDRGLELISARFTNRNENKFAGWISFGDGRRPETTDELGLHSELFRRQCNTPRTFGGTSYLTARLDWTRNADIWEYGLQDASAGRNSGLLARWVSDTPERISSGESLIASVDIVITRAAV